MAESGRFFTNTRHIPTTVGTMPATGERIPGGPYTLVQFIGGLIVLGLGWITIPLWGSGLFLSDLVVCLAAAGGSVWLLRYAPDDLTHVVTTTIGLGKILHDSAAGTFEGKALKHRKAPRIPAGLISSQETPMHELPAAADSPTPPRKKTRSLGRSSVDRLLSHAAPSQESSR